MKPLLLMSVALLGFSMPALAEEASPHNHAGVVSGGAADKELMDAHHKMMKDMDIKPTGDADKDFVTMMIPHHEGAVDMAKVELKHGKDPEIRKLAEGIVAAQEQEIKFMKEWLAKHQ